MFPGPGPGFLAAFIIVATIVVIGFIGIGGFIIFLLVKSRAQAASNAAQDVIVRSARVVGKRQHTWGENTRTDYYVTFEFPDGARVEFGVKPQEFGLLVEGDAGTLHSQGTWFKGFDRA